MSMTRAVLAVIFLVMVVAMPSALAWNPGGFIINNCNNERDAAHGLIGAHSNYLGVINSADLQFTNPAAGDIFVFQDGSFLVIPPASGGVKRTNLYYQLMKIDGTSEGHVATFTIYPCNPL